MAGSDQGHFYETRMRLRGLLAHQKWTLGKPWTPSQEEAWELLNEVEQLVKLLITVKQGLDPDNQTEFATQVRQAVRAHHPAGKGQSQM